MYLTPERLKTMGHGLDTDGIEAVAIRSAIARASAQIDAVCAVPRLPQKFDFRGGKMTDEAHAWYIDPYERPHPFQFWPYAGPVIAIQAFAIYATNTIKVEIDPANIFINNSAGYVELSSLNLTQFGVFGAGIVPLLGLYNPIAKMTYTYGYRFEVVDEVLEPVDARTYAAQNQFWTDATVTVKKDGTAVTGTDYTVNRTEGWIVFAANLAADVEVTASYTYSLPWEIAHACAAIVAQDIGEADLRRKGMEGVASLKIQEVSITRSSGTNERGREGSLTDDLPDEAARLLAGYTFVSTR